MPPKKRLKLLLDEMLPRKITKIKEKDTEIKRKRAGAKHRPSGSKNYRQSSHAIVGSRLTLYEPDMEKIGERSCLGTASQAVHGRAKLARLLL